MSLERRFSTTARNAARLAELVAIESVCAEGEKDAPCGSKAAAALAWVLQPRGGDGLSTRNVNNAAGHAEYGAGEKSPPC